MNAYFREHTEKEAYHQFADSVSRVFDEAGVELDGKHVFDAGMGPGYMLQRLLEHHKPESIGGLDFSEVAIEIARQTLPGGACYVGSIYDALPGQ